MNKILASAFLALAKSCGYTGSEADIEAQRAWLIKSARVINDPEGKAVDIKNVTVEADAPLVVKMYTMPSPTAPAAAPVADANPTNDTATIVKSALDTFAAQHGIVKRPNINGAITAPDTITVKSVEESIYERTPSRHFKEFKTADRFRDYFLTVLGRSPMYAGQAGCEAAAKRWYNSDATKRLGESAEFKSYLGGLHADQKAYTSSTQAGGGALTFMEFIPDLIQNVLQYGAARKVAQVWPMSQEQAFIPKMTGIHTLTYPLQTATASQSTGVTYSNVQLTAKTGICIVKLSKQLVQDANILVVDNVMEQIARTVAYTEEQELITAAGEATLGGCIGINSRFAAIGLSSAAGAVAGATTPATHTLAQLTAVIGTLPNYARKNAVWMCNPYHVGVTFARLAAAQGGVTFKETMEYGYVPMFLGQPIIEANVMNSTTDAANTVDILYGDFRRGTAIGDRMGLELDATDIRYWDDYSVGVRGVIRHDVVCHDVGTTTAAGPIVALYQT